MASVLCACGDPGAAAAVAPVAAALLRRGHQVSALATAVSERALLDAGVSATMVVNTFLPDCYERYGKPDALLAGASWGKHSELGLIEAAAPAGIRSLVVLDYWSHYKERFTKADGSTVFPDRVTVMDRRAREGMLAAGCPEDRVVITGAPQFDALAEARTNRDDAAAIRADAGVAPDARFVVFISQPIEIQLGRRLGYTESEVIGAVVGALDELAAVLAQPIVLGIRRHPLERMDTSPPSTERVRTVELPSGVDKIACLLAADVIVGMNSAMLVEAALLGLRAISVQPGLKVPDSLWTNETGATMAVYDRESIKSTLSAALDPSAELPRSAAMPFRIGGAADRVADELIRLLAEEN